MGTRIGDYAARSREAVREHPGVRQAVTGATLAFDDKRRRAYGEVDADAWRRWAEGGKNHLLTHLDDYLRAGLPAALGLHSGPSKSADIGGTVVTGVHGPGRCIAVLEGGVGQLPRADLKSDWFKIGFRISLIRIGC